jgi:hypothetical protein
VGDIHIDTHRWEGLTKHAVEMGSGGMIYIRSIIDIDSSIQKLKGGKFIDTAWRKHKSAFIFSKHGKCAKKSW